MSMMRLLPYQTANEALRAALSTEDPAIVPRADGSWDLFTEFDGVARFSVRATLDEVGLIATIPDGSAIEEELRLVVVARSVSSRRRKVLCSGPARTTTAQIDLDAREFSGKLELVALVARAGESSVVVPGLAHRAGAIVAEAPLGILWFDEPPVEAGHAIDIQWVDFREDDRFSPAHLFAVRLEGAPVIFLNTAIPHAYTVLTSKGTHGAKARIRDAVFAQIVHQVWSGILAHCFLVMASDEVEDPEERLAGLADWERQVVVDWAVNFYPGEQSADAAAVRLVEEVEEKGGMIALERLTDVIQARMDMLKPFNGLISDAHLFGTGDSQ